MVHEISHTGRAHTLPGGRYYLAVLGAGLAAVYVVRALSVRRRSAERWLSARGLVVDERMVDVVRRYLLRLRWARVAATVLFVVLSAVSVRYLNWPLGFVCTPYLICVLVAESLSPAPRRGRLRVAMVQRRGRSYFAPWFALGWARATLWLGGLLALSVPWLPGRHIFGDRVALMHGGLMVAAALSLELALDRITRRALPDRTVDLEVDTAIRVASARLATAAGVLGGSIGLLLSLALIGHQLPYPGVALQLLNLLLMAAIGLALSLLVPLRMWRPRTP